MSDKLKDICLLLERELLSDGPLFGDFKNIPWLISPRWFQLSEKEVDELRELGPALYSFLKGYHNLYYIDEEVAKLVEYGKPEYIVKLQKKVTNDLPLLIRADIVPTVNGFKVTEIETIVGGLGMGSKIKEAYLRIIPPEKHYAGALPQSFVKTVEQISGKGKIFLVPSFRSRYLPELKVFAKLCKRLGYDVEALAAEELKITLDAKLIWRLFEIYELPQLSIPNVPIYPPLKQFLEEKLWMALLHHPRYKNYWRSCLKTNFDLMINAVPPTWIIHKDYLQKDIEELMNLSRSQRQYVTKLSGYSEKAWGGRSFIYWGEPSLKRWKKFLSEVIKGDELYILQEFQDSIKYSFPVLMDNEIKEVKNLRARICPFYFRVGGKTELADIIVTLRKSKNVHGAVDSIRIPTAYKV